MATDAQRLLLGLRDYQGSLERHLLSLQQEFSTMDTRWHALSAVYEGSAAREYRAHWERTAPDLRITSTPVIALTVFWVNVLVGLRRPNVSEGWDECH